MINQPIPNELKDKITSFLLENQNEFTWFELTNKCNFQFGLKVSTYFYKKLLQTYTNISLDQIAKSKNTLLKERKLSSIQRYHLNKEIEKETVKDALTKIIQETAIAHKFPKVFKSKQRFTNKNDDNAWMISWTDFHFKGTPEDYAKINEGKKRIIELIHEHKIKELIFNELGDAVEGTVHWSGFLGLKQGQPELMTQYSWCMIDLLYEISHYIKKLHLNIIISSNHTETRPHSVKRGELPKEDLAYILGTNLSYYFNRHNSKIKVYTGEDLLFDCKGFNILLAHGHRIKSLKTHLEKYSTSHNVLIDYLFVGHWHAFSDAVHSKGTRKDDKVYDKRIIIVPGMVGNNEYGLENNYSTTAAFLFTKINSKYGLRYNEIIYVEK